MIGKIFHNRYEILEVLGTGGTSIVYKARDTILNRLVTLKILREQYASDDDFVRRFRHEAQAVACLSHPNIVSIYDVVFEGESHYLVMEYVEGCSLKDYIDQYGLLPMNQSLRIVAQMLMALDHAHAHNVIHRDIKPHNILLDTELNIKVTDFGIAIAVSDITQTYTKDVMGSVHYMSPEQVKGSQVFESSDIYSVGVVLYELLTGIQPFEGDNAIGVAMQHIQGQLMPPHKVNPDISLELSSVIMKAMRKDPEMRFASAREMLDALRAAKLTPSSPDEINAFQDDDPSLMGYNQDNYNNYDNYDRYDNYNNYDNYDNNYGYQQEYLQPQAPISNKKGNKFIVNGKLTKAGIIAVALSIVAVIGVVSIVSIFSSIFSGDKDVPVPDVVGKTIEEALAMLDEVNIQYQINRSYNDEYDLDVVYYQNIPAGQTVKEGRFLELTVSDGAEMAVVPSVEGIPFNEAVVALTNRNLKFETKEVVNNNVKSGNVISQSPDADEEVPVNTVITLIISKGKETTVPDFKGLTLEQAKAKLADSNLIVGETSKKESTEYVAGIVIGQSTKANNKVLEGSTIDFVVSDGPGPAPSKARVTYTLPDTQMQHNIKIIVVDTKGSHQEYEKNHFGGETVVQEVSFYGKGEIKVLMDDEVVFSQQVE